MDIQSILEKKEVQPYRMSVRYGIEKESQRVTLDGDLVRTDHPEALGSRSYHPYIQTDFSETQMELITPVTESDEELFQQLAAIHDVSYRSMPQNEMLWPLSMPPALPEKEIDIKIAKLDEFSDVLYRRHLAKIYGRRKQMVSGIHFNFEFGETLVKAMFDMQNEYKDYLHFKTDLYLKVTRNYLHYRWLVTYFYGASPLSQPRYFEDEEGPKEPVRSIRSSHYGYTNHEDVKVSYASIQKYLEDLDKMVETGKLLEDKEFYAPVRLRGGKKMSDLATSGIRYIELRNIDLNPFETYGISPEQVQFLHVFLLFLACQDEKEDSDQWIKEGDTKNDEVALEHPLKETKYKNEAEEKIAELEKFVEKYELFVSEDLFSHLKEMLEDPSQTLSGRLYQMSQKSSQKEFAVLQGRENQEKAWEKPYQLAGYESMELSTQLLLFDAIQKGIGQEVLDEQDQFIKLSFQGQVEFVKNGNMTSKDTYIAPLIMENKTVTKKILAKTGFKVPTGSEYTTIKQAEKEYLKYANVGFVIKPKSTNYGLGISIFKKGANFSDYQEAVQLAFQEDTAILIEEFLPGQEYRFFVVKDEVKAILLRVPANVVGDGIHSIEALVAKKNEDPLREKGYQSPLEKIELKETEQLMLKEQGYTKEAIPTKGTMVYLRENSNISTGGDSIDVTDQFSAGYKEIAVKATKALGATICGLDLIVPDTKRPITEKNSYGIIEANFNPMMHMHIYPYKGKSHRLTLDVLELLFPEAFEE
ncbi:MAG TPA: bifunctional glutamate--cysteine ligase GshA/glutathione synthetase GshB [Candidatus Tetragenococcus pullicola]|nr:bifunctional glutamate--cysteine ligase GshA/glutathione synthetase GshB [Candidatus Tetragenococcus pullicola]